MNPDVNRKRYPYTKKRVFLSAIIAAISTVFALSLLFLDAALVCYYFFSTFVAVIITYFLKKRLYPLLITENQASTDNKTERSQWKMLLIAFLILIGFIGLPLLLAGFLSGPSWFIVITSFISGVNISEIVLYIQARGNR